MFITDTDLLDRVGLRDELRTALARINHNAKRVGAPAFKIYSPIKMAVRLRKPAFGAVSNVGMHKFAGGEDFRIDNMIVTECGHMAGIEIIATFCPAKAVLATQVVSMTMALDQAFHVFPGLEAWCCDLGALLQHTQHAQAQAHEHAALAALPTVEEVTAGPLWGAW